MDKKRNGALCFWTFFFSMVLVIHYAVLMRPAAAERYPLLFYRGELAISFFFLLTGVMLAKHIHTLPADRCFEWKDTWTPVKELMRRYLPALILIWAVSFIAVNIVYYNDVNTLFNNFFASLIELLPIRNAGFFLRPVDNMSFYGNRVMDQAWVFSAVIIAAVILYPLYTKNKARFEYFIAPAAAILLIGYVYFKTNNLATDNTRIIDAKYFFYTFKSTFLAIGEICLGVVCYTLGAKLRDKKLSKAALGWLSVLEIGAYLSAVVYMQYFRFFPRYTDLLALIAIAVGVTVSFSEQGALSRFCGNKLFYALGRFALYPFLTFMVFAKTLPALMPNAGTLRLEVVYLGLTLVSALVLAALEKPFVKLLKAVKDLIVRPQTQKESA